MVNVMRILYATESMLLVAGLIFTGGYYEGLLDLSILGYLAKAHSIL
jgi:hypothetical protein